MGTDTFRWSQLAAERGQEGQGGWQAAAGLAWSARRAAAGYGKQQQAGRRQHQQHGIDSFSRPQAAAPRQQAPAHPTTPQAASVRHALVDTPSATQPAHLTARPHPHCLPSRLRPLAGCPRRKRVRAQRGGRRLRPTPQTRASCRPHEWEKKRTRASGVGGRSVGRAGRGLSRARRAMAIRLLSQRGAGDAGGQQARPPEALQKNSTPVHPARPHLSPSAVAMW